MKKYGILVFLSLILALVSCGGLGAGYVSTGETTNNETSSTYGSVVEFAQGDLEGRSVDSIVYGGLDHIVDGEFKIKIYFNGSFEKDKESKRYYTNSNDVIIIYEKKDILASLPSTSVYISHSADRDLLKSTSFSGKKGRASDSPVDSKFKGGKITLAKDFENRIFIYLNSEPRRDTLADRVLSINYDNQRDYK
ncbi:MAG: hypothetical protein JXR63_10495 [Spirochaetales bacterium]|nr:hypothetical protein [Spirochaetales bacterium]